MATSPSQHVQRSETLPQGIDLSPQDYFVLSRADSPISIHDLVLSSGLPAADATKIVERLLAAGALVQRQARQTGSHAAMPARSARLRQRAEDRRRQALAAALRGKESNPKEPKEPNQRTTQPAAPPSSQDRDPPQAHEQDTGSDGESDGENPERLERPRVPVSDSRVRERFALEIDQQRWVLALHDNHTQMSQFDILGIRPTHDIKLIKRAFHETSRALHPDAYYGRELGPFREILSALFREAKLAYAELRQEKVRAPWVDRRIENEARSRQQREAEEETQREQREAQARARREARTEERARRHREALQSRMHGEAARFVEQAEAAHKAGNLAKASNLFLLATRAEPDNAEIAARWKETNDAARKKRAAEAYGRAQNLLDLSNTADAMPLLLEAADADPTAEHLAHAAYAVRTHDTNRARNLAMAALDALNADVKVGNKRKPAETSTLHIRIGYAFLAVGQISSALGQANLAAALRPDDRDARALLKACKAK